MNHDDTELLIATVFSLLDSVNPSTSSVLDTLIQFDGDVEAAARHLNNVGGSKKRKRENTLASWLYPEKTSKYVDPEPSLKPPSKTRVQVASPAKKPAVDLMTVLRPPPSSDKRKATRLPPLLLSNSSLVSEHTPCTLHHAILPPELACRLFYTMVDASRTWNRNKWWLFDRVVESPHRTSFFARRTDGVGSDDSWQEAAQFW